MQWDASANAGFSTGTPWLRTNPDFASLNAALQERDPASVLNFYRSLIRLRRSEPALIYGRYELLMEDDPRIYAYLRADDTQRVVVITNLAPDEAHYAHPGLMLRHEHLLLANHAVDAHAPTERMTLRPYEARVYRA
jgi:alpha-glucosidase